MPGLHECKRCGYRFEDRPSLVAHEDACDGYAYGQPTGRVFYVVDGTTELRVNPPTDTEEYATWTEHRDSDGDLWYLSDHEGYTLDAEEFGPIGPYWNYMINAWTDNATEQRGSRWFIKPGFAGYNTTANNGSGYVSQRRAESVVLRYQDKEA